MAEKDYMKKIAAVVFSLFMIFPRMYGEDLTLSSMLKGWLENDRDLKSAALSLQKAELSKQKTDLSNGFDLTLSTGTMRMTFTENKESFSMEPSVKASLPAFRNFSLSAGSDLSFGTESQLENVALKAEIDILDTGKAAREYTKKTATRNVSEAERNLTEKAVTSEKSFYNTIKTLCKSGETIISSENSLYSEKITFAKTKAQGFSESSSTYRLQEMKVRDLEHSIEVAERSLKHDFENFVLKCGIGTDLSFFEFLSVLRSDLPKAEPLVFGDFPKSSYKKIEKALWNLEINELNRSSKKSYSLKGNAGYTFNNSTTKDGNGKNSDSVDAGISSTLPGMNVNAGVSIPVNPSAGPSITAGVTFSPNKIKLNNLEKNERLLDSKADNLSVETAMNDYDLDAADKAKARDDLIWEKSVVAENITRCRETEKNMKYYFDNGIITETEYLSAKTNLQKYLIEETLNELETIIFNCEIRNLFTDTIQN